jgi:hypothetical protein
VHLPEPLTPFVKAPVGGSPGPVRLDAREKRRGANRVALHPLRHAFVRGARQRLCSSQSSPRQANCPVVRVVPIAGVTSESVHIHKVDAGTGNPSGGASSGGPTASGDRAVQKT